MKEGSRNLAVAEIAALARRRSSHEVWVNDVAAVSWSEFGDLVEAARKQCRGKNLQGAIVEVIAEEKLSFLAWMFAAAAAGAVVAPLRPSYKSASPWKSVVEVDWRVTDGRLSYLKRGSMAPTATRLFGKLLTRRHPGLILATGGTTGTPKVVLHDLAALLATVPIKDGRPRRILPLMRFDHIGGLDIAWRALGAGNVIVEPPESLAPELVAAAIERHRVEVLPATPSFLNLFLSAGVHRSRDLSSLCVVPYGAEPMPSALLERLRVAFPQVAFLQRFGTSETGSLPVRTLGNGLALRDKKPGFAWKVVEGELWVRSPACALGYLSGDSGAFDEDGWYRTGDIAEAVPGGAIRLLGRRSDLINVGGEKVLPGEVESVLLRHPLIADCRVCAAPNGLVGEVVAAEIIWLGNDQDPIAVKRKIHVFARDLVARHKLPAIVRLVRAFGTNAALKKVRLART